MSTTFRIGDRGANDDDPSNAFRHPRGRGRRRAAGDIRRLALFHRPHPHALETARGLPEERPRIRRRLHHRGRSALGAGAQRRGEPAATWWCSIGWTKSRRDLVLQVPRHYGVERGTFALRSPARPNPIALSVVRLMRSRRQHGSTVVGLDCLDGTPLLDLKPYFASTDAVPDAVVGWHAARKDAGAAERHRDPDTMKSVRFGPRGCRLPTKHIDISKGTRTAAVNRLHRLIFAHAF